MPKLLQRNILRNSYISLISSLIAVVCWSVFMVSGYVYIYTLNLFLLVTCNPEIATSGLNVFVLPDYMYIAPYTKEQRKVTQIFQCCHVLVDTWFFNEYLHAVSCRIII